MLWKCITLISSDSWKIALRRIWSDRKVFLRGERKWQNYFQSLIANANSFKAAAITTLTPEPMDLSPSSMSDRHFLLPSSE